MWLWHFVLFCIQKHWKVLQEFWWCVSQQQYHQQHLCIKIYPFASCCCYSRYLHLWWNAKGRNHHFETKNSFDLIAVMILETNCTPKNGFMCHLQFECKWVDTWRWFYLCSWCFLLDFLCIYVLVCALKSRLLHVYTILLLMIKWNWTIKCYTIQLYATQCTQYLWVFWVC